ncbi:hypothetical protein [Argonema galeatum]|uniref:hypothetical protein n=1 Tax=Argonema galeatum TaxID=2942762 RepID=UPI0020118D03|nr:hypothetical protein [Argonema galeatum]MCL1463917.1 hypothetical protein [Argonema galeatum A003/A1]
MLRLIKRSHPTASSCNTSPVSSPQHHDTINTRRQKAASPQASKLRSKSRQSCLRSSE